MKKLLLVFLLVAGCGPRIVYSSLKSERGKVAQLVFVPSGHGSDLAPGYSFGENGGFTLTSVDIDIPARYAIVFECEHGTFSVEGYESLWRRLKVGMEVDIEYREVIRMDGDHGTVIDLDFVNAKEAVK